MKAAKIARIEWQNGYMAPVAGTEQLVPADLVLLAMGFVSPYATKVRGGIRSG